MSRNRYVVIALALIAALVFFRNYFLDPQSEIMRDRIQSQYLVLQKYKGFITGGQMTGEEMNAVIEEMGAIEKRLVEAKSEFLAAATLQEEISEIASKAGLRIHTIRPMEITKTEKYLNLPVYLEGNGNIKQVGDFLRLLESGKYLVRIDKLNMNITNVQNPRDLKVKIQTTGLARI